MGKDMTWKAAILTFLGAVVALVVIGVLLGLIGLPLWPFVFLLFFFASVDGFDMEKFKLDILSGVLGIFAGMSQAIVMQLTGNSTVALVAFFLCAMFLGASFVHGGTKWATLFGLMMLTMLTTIQMQPFQIAGCPTLTDMGALEAFLRVMGGYAIGVVLCFGLGKATVAVAAKQAGGSKA